MLDRIADLLEAEGEKPFGIRKGCTVGTLLGHELPR